ncbi:MAG: response regulator [Acidimicrobiia bacterium]|nr:response regulator [Acidimicrobiia bacterium]
MSDAHLRAVVADADSDKLGFVSDAAETAGYEVLAATDNGPDMLTLVEQYHPDLVLLDEDLHYLTGLDALPEIRESSPSTEVILLTRDEELRELAMRAGAFGVVYKTRLTELPGALGRAREFLESDRAPGDRRTGRDRRRRQDWQQVTRERRSGGDRRRGDGPGESDTGRS